MDGRDEGDEAAIIIAAHNLGIHCYLRQQRSHFCFEAFHSRLLSRWAALLTAAPLCRVSSWRDGGGHGPRSGGEKRPGGQAISGDRQELVHSNEQPRPGKLALRDVDPNVCAGEESGRQMETGRETDGDTERETNGDRERETNGDRERETDGDRERERNGDREREKNGDRERETDGDRETDI